ncbi:MAG: immune inhibitor A [Caldilineaceae bacterium]|nr:immune inhibitor A [Caldilineaceae bacterium]
MQSPQRRRNLIIAGVAALFLFLCIGTLGAASVIGYLLLRPVDSGEAVSIRIVEQPAVRATPTRPLWPTPKDAKPATSAHPAATPQPAVNETAAEAELDLFTEQELASLIIPTRDLRDLALRLKPDLDDIPIVVNDEEPNFDVGDRIEFWVSNVDENRQFQITAELIHKTEVAYAWVQVDREYDQRDLSRSIDRFSTQIYPKVREFFGSEWTPGVDNDPRLHILHADGMGSSVAGYYSSADQFSRLANQYSNEKEMFYISLPWLNRSGDYTYYETVLAHEFQHMIHWYNDRNEETWVNEGLSELAQEIAGYPPDTGFASIFVRTPDTQLNTWSEISGGNAAHYGSSYLFMAYLLQRFGEDVTKAIVAHPANGIRGIEQALQETGHDLTFNEVFADWLVANYIDDPGAFDGAGIYGYGQLDVPQIVLDEVHTRFPVNTRRTNVRNYGADYIGLRGSGDITLHFQGMTETKLADVIPYSGDFMWWSNRADDSNTRLTRLFDFTAIEPGDPIEMEVAMWYQIEVDYDYGYVVVSRDGEKWDILPGQQTTEENPSGNSFGHAYTGSSTINSRAPVWITETFDLSDYAGEEIFVRFEYVTDDAVNAPGWFVDDISIPAIDYAADFEDGADGWEGEGWLLTDNRLSQGWLLQILSLRRGNLVEVLQLPVNEDGAATVDIDGLGGNSEAILIVSAITPFTTEAADYEYQIERR